MTRWHSACLSDVSISILVYRHISLQECQTFCLTVSSSSICIPLLYLGFYHSFNSLFSSACYLITCTSVFAAGLSLHIQAALNLYRQAPSHPPYWGGAWWPLLLFVFFPSSTREKMNLVNQECTAVEKMMKTPDRCETITLFWFQNII